MSCHMDTKTSKGDVNYDDQTVALTWAATILRTGLKDGTNGRWTWRVTEPETTTMTRQTTDDRQRRLCCFCVYPDSVSKCSCPSGGQSGGSRPWDRCPPPQLPASEIKPVSFPPAWSAYWFLSNEQADPTPFDNSFMGCSTKSFDREK